MSKKKYKLTKENLGKKDKKQVIYEIKKDGKSSYYTNLKDATTKIENKEVANAYYKYYTEGNKYQENLNGSMLKSYKEAFIFKTSKIKLMLKYNAYLVSEEKYNNVVEKAKEEKITCSYDTDRKRLGELELPLAGKNVKYIKFSFHENEQEILEKRNQFYSKFNHSMFSFYEKVLKSDGELNIEDLKMLNFKQELLEIKKINGFDVSTSKFNEVQDFLRIAINPKRNNIKFVQDMIAEMYSNDIKDDVYIKILNKYYPEFKHWIYLEKSPITKGNSNKIVGITKDGSGARKYNYYLKNQLQGNIKNGDQYISKQSILNDFSKLGNDDRNDQINKVIEMYKLDNLEISVEQFIKEVKINEVTIKRLNGLVKDHYKNNVSTTEEPTPIEKLLLSYTHKYVKGRVDKCIKFAEDETHDNLHLYIQNTFKQKNVGKKLKMSLDNKIYENFKKHGKYIKLDKVRNKSKEEITLNELEQYKHLGQLNKMLAGNLAASRLHILNALDVENKFNINDDAFFNYDEITKNFENGSFNKKKFFDLNTDFTSKEQEDEFYKNIVLSIGKLRSKVLHFDDFKINVLFDQETKGGKLNKGEKVLNAIQSELNYYNKIQVQNRLSELKSTNIIDVYGDRKDDLTKVVENLSLETQKYSQFHRFDKVNSLLCNKQLGLLKDVEYRGTDVENTIKIATSARRNLMRLIYENFKRDIYAEHEHVMKKNVQKYDTYLDKRAKEEINNTYTIKEALEQGRKTFKSKYSIGTDFLEYSISSMYEQLQSSGGKMDNLHKVNKKWNSFIAYLFIQYIEEEFKSLSDFIKLDWNIKYVQNRVADSELESEYDKLKNTLNEQINEINLNNYSLPLINLAFTLNNRNLNTLIHGLVKFENNMKNLNQRVDFNGFIDRDYKIGKFDQTIQILDIIVKNRITLKNDTTITNFAYLFDIKDTEIENLEIQINETQKQRLYKAGDSHINFSQLDILKDYESIELFKNFFSKYKEYKISNKDIQQFEQLVKNNDGVKTAEVINKFSAELKKLKNKYTNEQYREIIQNIKNPKYKITHVVKKDQENINKLYNEYKEAMEKRVEYNYLKNKIRLTNIFDIINIFADLYEKLLEWTTRYERDVQYTKSGSGQLGIEAFKDEKKDNIRNKIAHFEFTNKNTINSISQLYEEMYTLFEYDKKYRKDIYTTLQNIFWKYGIVLPDDKSNNAYTKLPDIKTMSIKPRVHSKFNDVYLVSPEYAKMMVTFVFGNEAVNVEGVKVPEYLAKPGEKNYGGISFE